MNPSTYEEERSCSCQMLAAHCAGLVMSGPEQRVTGLTADSRQVRPGFIFAALSGSRTSGHHFVQAALHAGASAILHDGTLSLAAEVTQLRHRQPRQALAYLAAAFHGHPAREMTMIAITGTNGKTSTAAMIEAILSVQGAGGLKEERARIGVIGTTGIRYPNRLGTAQIIHENPLTTPDPVSLHRHLRAMADQQCTAVVVEVSSHALAQQRTAGISWRVAVFTNLTRDHLDYHGSEQAYFDSKATLFLPEAQRSHPADGKEYPDMAVIGTDDPWGEKLANHCKDVMPVWTFRSHDQALYADFRAREVALSWQSSRFRLIMPEEAVDLCLPCAGHFNVANALAAAATCRSLGVRSEVIAQGLQRFRPAPGRMEPIHAGQPFAVVVDYAHTPDALERLLYSARLLTKTGRILTVFGCGGERDRGKRAMMGQRAARLGDLCIITDDNPRSEDPAAIRQEILRGCQQASGHTLEIPDRTRAIAHALQQATPGDAVLIAGKGHEKVQIMADGSHPFDDLQVARNHLRKMGF